MWLATFATSGPNRDHTRDAHFVWRCERRASPPEPRVRANVSAQCESIFASRFARCDAMRLRFLPWLVLAAACTRAPRAPESVAPRFDYPSTRRDDTVDMLHGVAIADPYRWLEAETPE